MSIPINRAALEQAVANFGVDTLDTYLQLYHPDARLHFLPPGLPQGREGARQYYQEFLAAFPDARITLEDLVCEDEKIACRFTIRATHGGPFMGVAASGRRVALPAITILWFEDGQCIARWNDANPAALVQQLSASG